jgi:hypothetical protein
VTLVWRGGQPDHLPELADPDSVHAREHDVAYQEWVNDVFARGVADSVWDSRFFTTY